MTVDGRVAASWAVERDGDAVRLTVTPHVEIRRAARAGIRAEAKRIARFCEPDARTRRGGGRLGRVAPEVAHDRGRDRAGHGDLA